MRIKYIIPFPFDEAGIANRAAQLPDELRTPGVEYAFVPVKNSCRNADSAYELLILDAYIAEAGSGARRRATTRSSWTRSPTRVWRRSGRD